jgi:hypothetical protein
MASPEAASAPTASTSITPVARAQKVRERVPTCVIAECSGRPRCTRCTMALLTTNPLHYRDPQARRAPGGVIPEAAPQLQVMTLCRLW